jgi:small-conductance mechanosensitive channel
VTVKELVPLLGLEKASRFFALLDPQGKGDLSPHDFQTAVDEFVEEEQRVQRAIECNNQIIHRLSKTLLVASFTVLFLMAAPVFSVSIVPSLATLGTALLTFQFVFASQISEAFNGLFFVIVSHPFDVGDEIRVEGKMAGSYRVEEVGLWGCKFRGSEEKRRTFFTNSSLAKCSIANLRRSGEMSEEVFLELDMATTSNAKLVDLEASLVSHLKMHDRDLLPNVTLGSFVLLNAATLQCTFSVSHRSNFQDRALRARRARLVTSCLRGALEECRVGLAALDYGGHWAGR